MFIRDLILISRERDLKKNPSHLFLFFSISTLQYRDVLLYSIIIWCVFLVFCYEAIVVQSGKYQSMRMDCLASHYAMDMF